MRYKKYPLILIIILWGLCYVSPGLIFCQEGAETGNLDAAGKADPDSASSKLDKLLDLAEKDLGQLSQVRVSGMTGSPSLDTPVSTVSRQPSTIGRTPAAVYVVTNEMIRRSGAKTIPDVLRLVPGVNVARIDANTWSISIRGFGWRFSNKLLVQIDGRTIYTPLFGGVYWDEQDVLLEDVERIEVVRGPGATVWGSNAVNGIINIVTKNSKDTQGTYVESGTGTEELGYVNMRYGGGNGNDLHYRFYGKWFERGPGVSTDALPAWDDWRQARGGFRMDWDAGEDDKITFQGDYYNGYSGDKTRQPLFVPPYYQVMKDTAHESGANALLRWTHEIDEESNWAAQVYYDRMAHRWIDLNTLEDQDLFDFDFQHQFPGGDRHEWIWGCGYRHIRDRGGTSVAFTVIPPSRNYKIISYFVQDRITLVEDKWFLTMGCKFEHNDFTNFEYQPTVRLLWAPDDKRSIWGAVSRAVRLPARGELNGLVIQAPEITFPVPVYPTFYGNPDLISEDLIAYELGYREQTTENFSWDLALFLYDYRHLQIAEIGTPVPGPGGGFLLPIHDINAMACKSYGFEWTANYTINPRSKILGVYSFLVVDIPPLLPNQAYSSNREKNPRNQFSLQFSRDLGQNWELDLIGRYVDSLPASYVMGTVNVGVPSYFVGDVRLAWKPNKRFEWSVVGRNLLAGAHPEYDKDGIFNVFSTEVQQEVYTQIIWRH
jgi:iron complex outermembrane receptor protein